MPKGPSLFFLAQRRRPFGERSKKEGETHIKLKNKEKALWAPFGATKKMT